MDLARRLAVNEKFVACESFDDEVLAVNLDTGTYYSLMGSSARIWEALAAKLTFESVSERLVQIYDRPLDQLKAAVETFASELIAHGLMIDGEPDATELALPPLKQSGKVAFDTPKMTVHTDMQDLLLLDPIHDVDEAGWPVFKPAPDS